MSYIELKVIVFKLALALVVGGLTGLEREKSNQFAGFRTHILVAVGSCITSITALYLFNEYSNYTNMDPARLPAQILSGIGFLGAGAILKTSNTIRGLTTAAGIWVTSCIGIAIGYGYYELAIPAWVFVMITLYLLKSMDVVLSKEKQSILSISVSNLNVVSSIYSRFEDSNINIKNIEIDYIEGIYWKITFVISYNKKLILEELVKELKGLKNIMSIDYIY